MRKVPPQRNIYPHLFTKEFPIRIIVRCPEGHGCLCSRPWTLERGAKAGTAFFVASWPAYAAAGALVGTLVAGSLIVFSQNYLFSKAQLFFANISWLMRRAQHFHNNRSMSALSMHNVGTKGVPRI